MSLILGLDTNSFANKVIFSIGCIKKRQKNTFSHDKMLYLCSIIT